VKVARLDGVAVTVAPEADDVRRVAEATATPARRIHELATAAARERLAT